MVVCVVDIDGTLADAGHRLHLIQREEPDWPTFMSDELISLDKPQPGAKVTLDSFRALGYDVCFLTGRNERNREATVKWLQTHMGRTHAEPLFMRSEEFRGLAASIYKQKQIEEIRKIYTNPQFLFFDDDPFVARMFRNYGVVFRAPECWDVMSHGLGDIGIEPVLRF